MKIEFAAMACATILLVGCGERTASNDYCSKHKLYHSDHVNSVGKFNLLYTEAGIVDATLSIPYGSLRSTDPATGDDSIILDAVKTLKNVDQAFTIEGKQTCQQQQSDVRRDSGNLIAHYIFDCGSDNRLDNVDIRLMKHLPDLDELEANIDTPAVNKNFLISQQCNKPIYSY